jgi:sugar lactone lactonase YvrE
MSRWDSWVEPSARVDAFRELVREDALLELVADGFDFTEGPAWHPDGYLLFSDVPGDAVHRLVPGREPEPWVSPSGHANGLAIDRTGRVLGCQHVPAAVSVFTAGGKPEPLATHYEGKELNSPNDLCIRSDGAVYFTDPHPSGRTARWGQERPAELDFNGVYLLPAGSDAPVLLARFEFPNGICLSPDERTLYANDTKRMQVSAFDVHPDGTATGERVFLVEEGEMEFDAGGAPILGDDTGFPDGMKCDEHGNLYCTGPGGVWVVTPAGEHLGTIPTPVFASNLAFGGPEGRTLYITVAGGRPGSVYRIELAVRGAVWAEPVAQTSRQALVDDLLLKLRASRVTLRIDDVPGEVFPVKAESLAPGVNSIAGDRTIPIRESETFRWVERERRLLVQDDILSSPIAPAPALTGPYRARSQMLAPVFRGEDLVGLVSVHQVGELRRWTPDEVSLVERAVERLEAELGCV